MDDRGWGWTKSRVRQVQLVEWLAPRSSSADYVPVKPFYDGLQAQGTVTIQVVHDELRDLERRSLITLAAGIGGIESYSARATAQGRRASEELQAQRADKRLRKIACRDAMVDWLYAEDATSPKRQPPRSQMLTDPRGTWLAEPFTGDDLDTAAAWLSRHGLVKGVTSFGTDGPVRLYLTDDGATCAEDFSSDTTRFTTAGQPGHASLAVSHSAGTQAGSGNVQINHFYDPWRWQRPGTSPDSDSLEPGLAGAARSRATSGAQPLPFPAQFAHRAIALSNGLQTGTMLAIEVQASHELEQATAVMTSVTGPAGADTIPPPARLYWHPSREVSATIAQGASNLISIGRVGPMPPGAVMDSADQELPWTLPNGRWQVQLQLTARGHPAQHLTAAFTISPAEGFNTQCIEWTSLTAT